MDTATATATARMTDAEYGWFNAQRRHAVFCGDMTGLRALYATAAARFPDETFGRRHADLAAARYVAQDPRPYAKKRAETVKALTEPVGRWL